ncbi:hypothetical protein C8J57DRAFT_1339616 [Mycena rebaudengoi]|nr:hypothetical protein C8J57DRAFT_1339616 [Mycena rebaudengoi]
MLSARIGPQVSISISSASSIYTTTSLSTQWGPGSMTGKAILALGKSVLRGVEHLIILRRLSVIKSALPCFDDTVVNQEKIFLDLLELSRHGIYPKYIRIQTMKLILVQIAKGYHRYLRLAISQWEISNEEFEKWLSEIMAIPIFSKHGFIDESLVHAYFDCVPANQHPCSPCINFISEIMEENEYLTQGVLNARFLEMVLWSFGKEIHSKLGDEGCKDACNRAFALLSTTQAHHHRWIDYVTGYCPRGSLPTSIHQLLWAISATKSWSVVEHRLLEKHVRTMLEVSWPIGMASAWAEDVITSVFQKLHPPEVASEFSSSFPVWDGHRPISPRRRIPISMRVRWTLVRCIGNNGDVQQEMAAYLIRLSYPGKVGFLACIVEDIMAPFIHPSTAASVYITSLLSGGFEGFELVVQFLLGLSASNQFVQAALMNASILNILPLLSSSWNRYRIYDDVFRRVNYHRRFKSRSCYSLVTLHLLESIRSQGLAAVLNHNPLEGKLITSQGSTLLQPLFSRHVI